jgi:hypothetical protein
MESSALHQLEQIPGVGKNIARDMLNIGINSIDDLNVEPIASGSGINARYERTSIKGRNK